MASDQDTAKQRDRLERSQRVSDGLWSGTKWLAVSFLGVLATTLGLSFAVGTNTWAVGLIIAAFVSIGVGGLAAVTATIMTKSRLRYLDRKEVPSNPWPLYVAIALQLMSFFTVLGTQASAIGVAVADAARPAATLDERLADRVSKFNAVTSEADPPAIADAQERIEGFCAEHVEDDKATNLFRDVCCRFDGGKHPDRDTRDELIKRLRSDS